MSRCALLDVDGTLIDSNHAHAASWVETAAEMGFDVPLERVRPLIGMGGDKLIPELFGVEADSRQGKAMSARRLEIFRQRYLPAITPFPEVRRLVERLRRDGLTLVIATSAKGDELTDLLKVAGVGDLIDETTTSSDAESSKPDPDIIEAALRRGGCPARGAIMLGDTPYDVEAAGRAGVPIIALRCGGWDDAALRGALAIYDDPAQLLREYDRSPLARVG
jgi:HAD superfamily hydrolase (TIGR01509 family)